MQQDQLESRMEKNLRISGYQSKKKYQSRIGNQNQLVDVLKKIIENV